MIQIKRILKTSVFPAEGYMEFFKYQRQHIGLKDRSFYQRLYYAVDKS